MAQIKVGLAKGFHRDAELRRAFSDSGMSGLNIEMARRNEKLAAALARKAAEAVAESIGTESGKWAGLRRQQSTGRLVAITGKVSSSGGAANGNTFATPLSFGVGNEAYLDKQTARLGHYWRSFEFGNERLVGRQITILPKSSSGRPSRGRTLSQDPGLRMVNDGSSFKFTNTINRPILPHHVYSNLVERPEAMDMLRPLARQYFKQAMNLVFRG